MLEVAVVCCRLINHTCLAARTRCTSPSGLTQGDTSVSMREQPAARDYLGGMAEEIQEIGRRGAATIKRWLEATTYIELPYDAYNNRIDCLVDTFDGRKQFDLRGHMLVGEKTPVIVEAKKYTTPGGQYNEFMKFLAIAYASTAKELEDYGDTRKSSFFWVTSHPFNLQNWSKFESAEHMKEALAKNPKYVKGHTIIDELVFEVAGRITVLVFNPKQENLSLTRHELETIRPHLVRKVATL